MFRGLVWLLSLGALSRWGSSQWPAVTACSRVFASLCFRNHCDPAGSGNAGRGEGSAPLPWGHPLQPGPQEYWRDIKGIPKHILQRMSWEPSEATGPCCLRLPALRRTSPGGQAVAPAELALLTGRAGEKRRKPSQLLSSLSGAGSCDPGQPGSGRGALSSPRRSSNCAAAVPPLQTRASSPPRTSSTGSSARTSLSDTLEGTPSALLSPAWR